MEFCGSMYELYILCCTTKILYNTYNFWHCFMRTVPVAKLCLYSYLENASSSSCCKDRFSCLSSHSSQGQIYSFNPCESSQRKFCNICISHQMKYFMDRPHFPHSPKVVRTLVRYMRFSFRLICLRRKCIIKIDYI